VRSHAKAATVGSTGGQASDLGRMGRRRWASIAGLVLAALVVLVSAASAEPSERLSSFGPDGTEATDFEQVGSVALDHQTGEVYVLDSEAGSLYKFDADGQPVDWGGTAPYITGNRIDGLSPYPWRGQSQVAVDSSSHAVYVTDQHSLRALQANGEPLTFTAGPGAGSSEIPGFGALNGVAVDVNGALYAADRAADTVTVYDATGGLVTSVAAPEPQNLAVSTGGTLYAMKGEFSIQKFTPDSFPVSGSTTYAAGTSIVPSASGAFVQSVGVDPVSNDVYVVESFFSTSWIVVYDESATLLRSYGKPGTPNDAEGFGGHSLGIAVAGDGDIEFYVGNSALANNGTGEPAYSKVDIFGVPEIFEGPPSVESTSAIAVTADSATLRAQIDPNTAATTYRFEYGPGECSASACTSVPIAPAAIGDGQEPVTVTQAIIGLQADTTYHYRVVAENSFGLTEGSDGAFTTQARGLGFQLADSRAWEMVSPVDKHGGELHGSALGLIQAAADGGAIAYASKGSIEAEPDGNRSIEMTTVLARRGAAGWRSKDLTPASARPVSYALGFQSQHNLFSPDLSKAIVEPRDGTILSPMASERTPYLSEITEPPAYIPLVTGKEGFANVPPGTQFGGDPDKAVGPVRLAGANPEMSHVVLKSLVPLVDGITSGSALYLWSAGQLQPVSVLPASEGGSVAGAEWMATGPWGSMRHAISDAGARIFWAPGSSNALYMRDTAQGETARLDVVQPGATGSGQASPLFQGANPEATVAFFTDSRKLTADASPGGRDLYRCELPAGPATACATLTTISSPGGGGDSARVLGGLSGLSEDATRLYFVARGVLDPAPNQFGDSAESGRPNLYFWQEGVGVRYIATLSENDEPAWGQAYSLNAGSSPSGRYLSFMSERSLTGYVNLEETSGEPVQEVFRYDAVEDRLDCVSCNPFGSAPQGELVDEIAGSAPLVDSRDLWLGNWLAAALPQPTVMENDAVSLHQPRAVLDNGRIFFNAIDSLVPADSNGEWDVYQWEPTGVGDCNVSSGGAAIARSADGCVSLLSSGTAEEEAGFLDASETGGDAFFLTVAKLSVTDEDDELDVYDARVDGVPATLSPRGECQGEACQPPATPPLDPTPASSAFEGEGNVRPKGTRRCAKGKRRVRRGGRVRCVARRQSKERQRKSRAGQERRARR
jgi:hypothetical protein